MKNNTCSKKLTYLWIVALVVIVAGVVVSALWGFNRGGDLADSKNLSVEYDVFMTLKEDRLENFEASCEDILAECGLSAIDKTVSESVNGGVLEYEFAVDADSEALKSAVAKIEALVATEEYANGSYNVTYNTEIAQFNVCSLISKEAIALAVALVVASVYVSLRYSGKMGVAYFAGAVLSEALTYALVALLRVPVSTAISSVSLVVVAIYSLFAVLVLSAIKHSEKEAQRGAQAAEVVSSALVGCKSVRNVAFVLTSVAFLVLSVVAAILANGYMASCLLAAVASVYSAYLLVPALYTSVKTSDDEKASAKAKNLYSDN